MHQIKVHKHAFARRVCFVTAAARSTLTESETTQKHQKRRTGSREESEDIASRIEREKEKDRNKRRMTGAEGCKCFLHVCMQYTCLYKTAWMRMRVQTCGDDVAHHLIVYSRKLRVPPLAYTHTREQCDDDGRLLHRSAKHYEMNGNVQKTQRIGRE